MRTSPLTKAGAVVAATASLALGLAGPAAADIYPQSGDVTGSGSDTLQYTADFIFDGTPGGAAGYNAGKKNRAFSFDATADANGRLMYDAAGVAIAPTVVMRAGTVPVVRPNGSGSGAKALYQDGYQGAGKANVNFARMSALVSCTDNSAAVAAGTGGLHSVQFATEDLRIAVAKSGTNAPSSLPIAVLVDIYKGAITTWGQVPGYAGPAPTATIVPQIPQAGSGTGSSFRADLQAANGGVAVTLANPNLQTVQENDYTSITSPPPSSAGPVSPANVIAPFSGGRIGLNDTGFLGAGAQNAVVQLTGASSYLNARSLYFVFRENDLNSSTPFQPGGTQNFVKTLFAGSTNPVVKSPAYAANIQAAGHTPAYRDLGAPGQANVSCK